jgi:DNA-directed RNA polymerase specialized sigma24 family protein
LLRRHVRVVPVDEQNLVVVDKYTPEPGSGLITAERDAALWRCFRQLPERDQELLRALLASDRLSYAVVAAALEMPVGSIGPTRMRALKRLQVILEETDYAFCAQADR